MHPSSAAALAVLRQAADTLLAHQPGAPPLQSIFSVIEPPDGVEPTPSFLAARPFRIERDTLFAVPSAETVQANADPTLRDTFVVAYRTLTDGAGDLVADETTLDQLFFLLQEYAWAVPSREPAVSLFDQARTDAALAAATAGAADDGVLLLGGDISGIQSFLYTLPAAGATKGLRARSFYLQLLTDALARWLLLRAQLPRTNLLYSGGGRFYLVLPLAAEAEVAAWRRELGLVMLRRHGGELYLSLGATAFEAAALTHPETFREHWQQLNDAVNADKRRRFAALGPEVLAAEVFAPQGPGGSYRQVCVVCRYQGAAGEFLRYRADPERDICVLCESFEDLARELHNAEFLLLTPTTPQIPPARSRVVARQVLRDLGLDIMPARSTAQVRSHLVGRERVQVLGLRQPIAAELRQELRARGAVYGMRPLVNETATISPEDETELADWENDHLEEAEQLQAGLVKTFGMLVEQSAGIKRLGVLRMDVDDLGDLFRHSLRDANLARIGSLSAALMRFFEGWVGARCHELNQGSRQRVYAVYSGGDDLFIVGSWDLLPQLARTIRADLRAYALNERVRLSAGLSLHGAKFPLYQAAEAAHAELERAKARPGKDAWGFLEQVVGWGAPADDVFALQEQLADYIGGSPPRLSRAALQTMQALYSQYAQALKADQRQGAARTPSSRFFFGPWIWRGVYQLARMADVQRRRDREVAVLLDAIRGRLTEGHDQPAGSGARFIERAGLAARWTQLLVRKEQR